MKVDNYFIKEKDESNKRNGLKIFTVKNEIFNKWEEDAPKTTKNAYFVKIKTKKPRPLW